MCRWVGYMGDAIRPELLLCEAEHSLIRQSLASELREEPVNGDGFGLGWYGNRETPGIYRSVAPAWGDANLRELCAQVDSGLFLAHIRAATRAPVQQTNCHPFRYRKWLFVHNGYVEDFSRVRRELLLAVTAPYFDNIDGSTDSELLFHLALSFGLEERPIAALERMAGFVEEVCGRQGIAEPLQMTLGLSDGVRLYAVRYASGSVANSLFVNESVADVRALYPDRKRKHHFRDDARMIVSEPLVKLHGVWREIPPGTALVVHHGELEMSTFRPSARA